MKRAKFKLDREKKSKTHFHFKITDFFYPRKQSMIRNPWIIMLIV